MTIPKESLTCVALLSRALVALLALANLTLGHAHADAAAVVTLASTPERVAAGETVMLSVNISDIETLYGVELHLLFDAQRLQALPGADGKAATPGDLMAHDFVALNAYNNAAGTIDYAAAQMNPAAPVSGSGALLTLRFKALAAGNATVNFTSVILSDINGTPLAATTANMVIVVLGDGATPLPATPEPGVTALAPPADAPGAAIDAPTAAAATQTPPNAATAEPRGGATTAVSATLSQPTRQAADNASVAPSAATSTPILTSVAGVDMAAPAARAPAAEAAAPTPARVAALAQAPALAEAPSRVKAVPTASTETRNIALLGSGAMSLLFSAAILLEWRRASRK